MIYLDNAATTFPKPSAVTEEMRICMQEYCGNPGRGAHKLSLKAAEKVFECRETAAEMFGAAGADRVFFTPNATFGINAVIKGLLKQGDHVLISDMEHNAVWRPIHKLAEQGLIEYGIFKTFSAEPRPSPRRICAELERALKPNTRLVICLHASNICSRILPIRAIGELCRRRGVLFAVDGAQSAGHEHISVEDMGITALCLPGHKGLYGPQGSGMVVLSRDAVLQTLTEGGNGVDSLSPHMPDSSPERYEAGTLSVPSIVGLLEGMKAVRKAGISAIARKEAELCERISYMLGSTRGVKLYGNGNRGNIVLFNIDGMPSERTAEELDRRGICVRAGYHCAGLAHSTLGTPDGGAVRVSVGMFNQLSEAEALYSAIADIIRSP